MLLAPVVRGERERRQEHCHILFSHSVHIGNSEYTEAPPWCFGPRHATTYLNFAATVQLQTEPIVAILRSRDCVHLRAIAIIIRFATSQCQPSRVSNPQDLVLATVITCQAGSIFYHMLPNLTNSDPE